MAGGQALHQRVTRGRAVPKVHDALKQETAYQRFNAKLAILITKGVGSMTCAYVFALLALVSLPSVLKEHSVVTLVAWVAQTFLQLVLLSIILVGTNLQSVAADKRAEATYQDSEAILHEIAHLRTLLESPPTQSSDDAIS